MIRKDFTINTVALKHGWKHTKSISVTIEREEAIQVAIEVFRELVNDYKTEICRLEKEMDSKFAELKLKETKLYLQEKFGFVL